MARKPRRPPTRPTACASSAVGTRWPIRRRCRDRPGTLAARERCSIRSSRSAGGSGWGGGGGGRGVLWRGALAGGEEGLLAPIAATGGRMEREGGESVPVDIVTGVAETREASLFLVEKYRDRRLADRVFELAWTHSQVLLRQINATEADTQLYGQLAGAVVYANAALRANPAVLALNRRGQSGLWS